MKGGDWKWEGAVEAVQNATKSEVKEGQMQLETFRKSTCAAEKMNDKETTVLWRKGCG